MHIYILFYIIFHYGSSNSEGLNKYSSLGYTGPIVYRQQIFIEIVLEAAQPSARCSGGIKECMTQSLPSRSSQSLGKTGLPLTRQLYMIKSINKSLRV